MVVLVMFYINCMRHSSNFNKNPPFLAHTNTRYDPKQGSCSPNSSTTSSTATTTTNNSGDDSFSRDGSLTHSSELLLKHKCLHGTDPSQFYHNFYDQVNVLNCRCKNELQISGRNVHNSRNQRMLVKENFNANNQQNIFSISKRNGFDGVQPETHIYHEISTQMNHRNEGASLNPYDDYLSDNNLFIYPVNGLRNDSKQLTRMKEEKTDQTLFNELSSGLIV